MPLTAGIGKFGIMLVVIFVVTCTTPADAKKSVLDYTDVDVEKLYEEWEVRLIAITGQMSSSVLIDRVV